MVATCSSSCSINQTKLVRSFYLHKRFHKYSLNTNKIREIQGIPRNLTTLFLISNFQFFALTYICTYILSTFLDYAGNIFSLNYRFQSLVRKKSQGLKDLRANMIDLNLEYLSSEL